MFIDNRETKQRKGHRIFTNYLSRDKYVGRDTTHFDSEDDYRRGCRNVSHCQQQQSYSGLRSPGRSNSTYSLTLKMTTAQVVETSVTVNNNSSIQDYVQPDD